MHLREHFSLFQAFQKINKKKKDKHTQYIKQGLSCVLSLAVLLSSWMGVLLPMTNTSTVLASEVSVQEIVFGAEDFVIEGDVLASLTEAGRNKVQNNPTASFQLSAVNGATKVGASLFARLPMQNLTLAEGITEVQDHALQGTGLQTLVLPSTLQSLGHYALADNQVRSLVFPHALQNIGDFALYNNKLTEVETAAQSIGANAFAFNLLSRATLTQATQVGEAAFFDNSSLEKVFLNASHLTDSVFAGAVFNAPTPVKVYAENSPAFTSNDPACYVVNPVQVKLSLKDKSNQGLLRSTVDSEHFAADFPLTLSVPSVDAYRVVDDKVQGNQITLTAAQIQNFEVAVDILYERLAQPQILVSEAKQLTWPINRRLIARELLQDIRFLNAEGQEINPFTDANKTLLNDAITLTPIALPAPNQETTQEVKIVYTDATSGLTVEKILTFHYSNKTDEEEEIIPGKEWLYKDFRYNGSRLEGFSESGLQRLETNKNVVLPGYNPSTKEKITFIAHAFRGKRMDTVDFAQMESLVNIGSFSFVDTGLSALLNFDKLKNLEIIEVQAFYSSDKNNNATKMKVEEIDFSALKKLKQIQNHAFENGSLTSLTLENLPDFSRLGNSAFRNNDLRSVVLQNLPKLPEIESMSLADNEALISFTLANVPLLWRINTDAVINSGLESLTLENLPALREIEPRAFGGGKLKQLTFNNLPSLVKIHDRAFEYNQLTELDFTSIPSIQYLSGFNNNKLQTVNFQGLNELTTIGVMAFYHNKELQDIVLEDLPKLATISGHAFDLGHIREGESKVNNIVLRNLPLLTQIQHRSFGWTGFKNLVLENLPLLRSIDDYAFYLHNAKELTLKDLPLLQNIGHGAFFPLGEKTLTTLTLENLPSLTSIGNEAFKSKDLAILNMTGADVPALQSLGNSVFQNGTLTDTLDLTQYTQLTSLGSHVFNQNNFSKIILKGHPTLKTIGADALSGVDMLYRKLELTDMPNLESIGAWAFSGIGSDRKFLKEVVIANNPKLKNLDGFGYNFDLKTLQLANLPALERISSNAFEEATNLESLDLTPFNTLKIIGVKAFVNTKISRLQLPTSVEQIWESAYLNAPISDLDLSSLTNLKFIGSKAFIQGAVNHNGENGFVTPSRFVLPVTSQPIDLGWHVASLREDQLDFRQTPDVKLNFLSAKPFRTQNQSLVMHFANDSQVNFPANVNNLDGLDANNPTIIYIDNITDPSKFANLPAGILINPGKVQIEYFNERTGQRIAGSSVDTKYMVAGNSFTPPTFVGMTFQGIDNNASSFASYDAATNKVTLTQTPEGERVLTLRYNEPGAVVANEYLITVKRIINPETEFHYPWRIMNVEAHYDLKNIDLATERGVKLVVQLPPHASSRTDHVAFPPNIPGITLSKPAYFNAAAKQIIYEIAQFTEPNTNITLRVGFQFDPLDTPLRIEERVQATYILPDGRRKGPIGESDIFRPYYRTPQFVKRNNYGDTQDHYLSASPGSNNLYTDFSVPYTFSFYHGERRLSRLVITDTLPTYTRINEAGQEEQARAVFDPSKNGAWTLSADGTSVSYTMDESLLDRLIEFNGKGFYNFDIVGRGIPKLILDYPRAAEKKDIVNTATAEFFVKDPEAQDPISWTFTSHKTDRIHLIDWVNETGFDKSGYEVLIPYDDDTNKDHPWYLALAFAKEGREREGVPTYYRSRYSNIDFWDYAMDVQNAPNQTILRYAGFLSTHDLEIDVYEQAFPHDVWGSRPTEQQISAWATPIARYSLVAGQRLDMPKDIAHRAKTVRFRYEKEIDSNTTDGHLPENARTQNRRMNDRIQINIYSRLRDGTEVPNKFIPNRLNHARVYYTKTIPDRPERNLEAVASDWEVKLNLRADRRINVTKGSNYDNNIIRDETATISYTVGYEPSFSDWRIPGTFRLKNFRLVDVYPEELKPFRVELNPEFEKVGGYYKSTQIGEGIKYEFIAPSVPGIFPDNTRWIAKIHGKIKEGTAGNAEVYNRAYIQVEQDRLPDDPILHLNKAATPEENNAELTTAINRISFAYNDSLIARKYIRRSSVNGPWVEHIETLPDEELEYKFVISNNMPKQIEKLEILDIFPAIGDIRHVHNLDGSKDARNSDFANILLQGELVSVKSTHFKTKAVTHFSPSDFPVKMIKKTDDFPKTGAEGEVKPWVDKALANPDVYLTDDPAQAKAILVGGVATSIVPAESNIEMVVRMKTPPKAYADLSQWEGKRAVNSFAYFYGSAYRYKEVPNVTNTLSTAKRSMKFRKVEAGTDKGLEGAEFVLKQEGKADKYAISDPDGWLYFHGIEYAPFTLQEVVAPKGYKLDLKEIPYNLSGNDYFNDKQDPNYDPYTLHVGNIVLENEPLPPPDPVDTKRYSITVNKKDIQNQNLALVKFKLENLSNGEVAEALTNKNGQLVFENLRKGQYRLTETANLQRYSFISPVVFDLPLPDDFVSSSIQNSTKEIDASNPDLTHYRWEIHNQRYRLDLYKLGIEDLSRSKVDHELKLNEGQKLKGVTFKLYETDKNAGESLTGQVAESFIANLVTDEKGKASLQDVKANRIYKLVEEQGALAYEKRQTPIYFYVNTQGAVHTADNQPYVREDVLLVSNLRATVTSSVSIKKVDDATGAALAGAKFQLSKMENGVYVPLANNKAVQITDNLGEVVFANLSYGNYRLEEIEAPAGYLRSLEKIEFLVQPYRSQAFSYTVKNKKAELRIAKVEVVSGPYETKALAEQAYQAMVDKTDLLVAEKTVYRALRGARFRLTENYEVDGVRKNAELVPHQTSDSDGNSVYAYSEGLTEYGSYLLEEVQAPEGYVGIAPRVLKMDQLMNYEVPVQTLYIPNTRRLGSIAVAKFADVSHLVLPNAEFSLYRGHLTRAELSDASLVERKITNAKGTLRFDNLPLGAYTLAETKAPERYQLDTAVHHINLTSAQSVQSYSFYNNVDTITLKLKKVDDFGQAITQLAGAKFDLYYNGKFHSTASVSNQAGEEGILYFTSVPSMGQYEIREVIAPTGYSIMGDGRLRFQAKTALADDETKTMVNKRKISISAQKVWQGGKESERPDVYFKLFRQVEGGTEEAVPDAEIKAIGKVNQTVNFGAFDSYQNAADGTQKAYTYTVKEVDAQGQVLNLASKHYTASTETQSTVDPATQIELSRQITVTNTYATPKINLKVQKTWVGGENDVKPDLKFVLYRRIGIDGQEESVPNQEQAVPKEAPLLNRAVNAVLSIFTANNQETRVEVQFTDLDVTDAQGNPYTYIVKEVKADGTALDESLNYQVVQNNVEASLVIENNVQMLTASLENRYVSPKREVSVEKVWVGGRASERPQTWFKLWRKVGEQGTPEAISERKTLLVTDATASQTLTWTQLEQKDPHGNDYIYYVQEVNAEGEDFVPVNYVKEENALRVTNTYVSPKIEKEVKKVWQTVAGENIPASVTLHLKRGISQDQRTELVETVQLNAQKADPADQQGKTWMHRFTNLDLTDALGNPYYYTVEENPVVGYTSSLSTESTSREANATERFVITNTQTTTSKAVEKRWVNLSGESNPSEVVVQLKRNGVDYLAPVTLRADALDASQDFKHSFTNLPEYDAEGQPYVYTLSETQVPAYEAPVIDEVNGIITNTRSVHHLEVSKIWNDLSGNLDKPTEITLHLYQNKAQGSRPYKTVVLTGQGDTWKHTFENLPTYDLAGRPYVYEIDEEVVAGYEKLVRDASVTNTRTLTSVSVNKTWQMTEAIYPETLTYRLYRDGVEIAQHTVQAPANPSAPGAFNYTFTEDASGNKLPLTNPSTKQNYVYTVSEDEVPGFTTNIQGTNITNIQNTVEVRMTKKWLKGKKPAATLVLRRKVVLADGSEEIDANFASSTTVQAENGQKDGDYLVVHTPTKNYPTHDAKGRAYVYFATEPDVPKNYAKEEKGLTVTNTYTIPTGEVDAVKIWQEVRQFQKAPTIYFKLYRKIESLNIDEEVPGAEVIKLEGFENKTEDIVIHVPVQWTEIDLTNDDAVPYTFYVKELNSEGKHISPVGFLKTEDGLRVFNRRVYWHSDPKEITLEEDPKETPKNKEKDPVPDTGAFSSVKK